jgi:hypothetical protein
MFIQGSRSISKPLNGVLAGLMIKVLLNDRQAYRSYARLLTLIKTSQILLKTEGLHADSAEDLAARFARLEIVDERAQRFRDNLLSAVAEEAKKLPKGEIGLASSDRCESVIGKEKLFSNTKPASGDRQIHPDDPCISDQHHGRASAYGNAERAYS